MAADSAPPEPPKLHGRAFYNSIGKPKYVVAPMVDQSEFAWRLLTRSFLPPDLRSSILAYTPMFHARLFADSPKYRGSHFESTKPGSDGKEEAYLDGRHDVDRPLIVQFCANDPDALLAAAKEVQAHCDAVDLNLGCPQGIAKRGNYGAFLQEDWDTISKMIRALHEGLDIPVTAKMRILESKERTLDYAKMILEAGASVITVHGRRREQKGHYTGLADYSYIKYLRDNLPPETVIFANGNILQHSDIAYCLEQTGADAVMSAEGNLYDPSIFAPAPPTRVDGEVEREYWIGRDGKGGYRADAVLRRYMDIIQRYVMSREPPRRAPLSVLSDAATSDQVPTAATNGSLKHGRDEDDESSTKKQKLDPASADTPEQSVAPQPNGNGSVTEKLSKKQLKKQQKKEQPQNGKHERTSNPNLIAMQAHCFHILRPLVARHHNVRDALARCKAGDVDAYENVLTLTEAAVKVGLLEYEKNPAAFEEPEDADAKTEGDETAVNEESSDEAVRRCKRPYWVCQAYVRPLPKEALEKGSVQLSKKQRRQQELEAEEAKKAGVVDGGRIEEVEPEVKKDVLDSGEGGEEDEGLVRVPAQGMVAG